MGQDRGRGARVAAGIVAAVRRCVVPHGGVAGWSGCLPPQAGELSDGVIPIRSMVLVVVLAIAGGQVLSGCGSSPRDEETTRVVDALTDWSTQFSAVEEALTLRVEAERRGDTGEANRLESEILKQMRPMERYGRDARAFFDDPTASVARSVTRCGDALTEFAYVFRTDPPVGEFDKARRLADLATVATSSCRSAGRVLGMEVSE